MFADGKFPGENDSAGSIGRRPAEYDPICRRYDNHLKRVFVHNNGRAKRFLRAIYGFTRWPGEPQSSGIGQWREHIIGLSGAAQRRARQGHRTRRGTSTTFPCPDMLYGATVRSQIPRGKIKKITFGPGIDWDEFVDRFRERHSREKPHRADRRRSALPCRRNSSIIRRSRFSCWPIRTGTFSRKPSRRSPSNTNRFPPVFSIEESEQTTDDYLGHGQYLQNLPDSERRCG